MNILAHVSEKLEGRLELGMDGFRGSSPLSLPLAFALLCSTR